MIYVGIDIASTKHDFIMLNDDGVFNSRRSTTIPNSIEGYKKLHETITEFCGVSNYFEVRIGLESTGFYHLNLLFFLLLKAVPPFLLYVAVHYFLQCVLRDGENC